MVDGLNAVEIAVGGVAGAAFGSIFDGITEVLRNAAEFTTSHSNIKSTLEALQPLIREIEGKNNRLLLQDEELKDLKNEIEAGVKRVKEFSERSVWNCCKRPFYNMELDGMDKSLKRLLRILQVQGVRDVKEVLVQVKEVLVQVKEVVLVRVEEGLVRVNDCKTDANKIVNQFDNYKTEIVEKFSAWNAKTFDQVVSNQKEIIELRYKMDAVLERIEGRSDFVQISEKGQEEIDDEQRNTKDQGRRKNTKTKRDKKEKIGDKHPDTIKKLGMLGLSYRYEFSLGQEEIGDEHQDSEELPSQEEIDDDRQDNEDLSSDEHPYTVKKLGMLGLRYGFSLGMSSEELPSQEEIGDEHPDTVKKLGMLGLSYGFPLGMSSEELPGQEEIGDEHPDTVKKLGMLGLSYGFPLGMSSEELPGQEEIGDEHPDTVKKLGMLGLSYGFSLGQEEIGDE